MSHCVLLTGLGNPRSQRSVEAYVFYVNVKSRHIPQVTVSVNYVIVFFIETFLVFHHN